MPADAPALQSLDGLRYLSILQMRFRVVRFWRRLFSPRQAVASLLAVGFVSLYLLAGLTLLSRREANSPEQLRLWLSGGMVLYTLFHTIKHLWSTPAADVDSVTMTDADRLWLGGGPVARRTLVIREAAASVPAALAKTGLLGVVLWRDADVLPCLLSGMFLALIALELIRRLITHGIDGLTMQQRKIGRGFSVLVGVAIVGQVALQTWFATPRHSDPVIYLLNGMVEVGQYAGTPAIQTSAVALLPAATLASGQSFGFLMSLPGILAMALMLCLSVCVIFGLTAALIRVDAWSSRRRISIERSRLVALQSSALAGRSRVTIDPRLRRTSGVERFGTWLAKFVPARHVGILGIVVRQLHCVRRYWINVAVSFAIPMALSLSPLVTDQSAKQWMFVIGGIALSSLLLAPPALQIDFRRDLKRMFLIRSLPLGHRAMCFGMMSVPVSITILFQWTTLSMGAAIASPPIWQFVWLLAALPALAVVTFTVENALFLAFPHHVHAQGIAMVIRAKITFLWKGLMLAIAPIGLITFIMLCETVLPSQLVGPITFTGSLLAFWIVAALSAWTLVRCWARFDPIVDMPPE